MRFAGPVLFSIEQGTFNVDLERHRLAISYSDDDDRTGRQRFRRGNIPQGAGVYSADGNPGSLRNTTEDKVILLAVLIVPQPVGEGETDTLSATEKTPAATPAS